MNDIVFLKYTNDIAQRYEGEGINGNYYLGGLFFCTVGEFRSIMGLEGTISCHIKVLDNGVGRYIGETFSLKVPEIEVVNNDTDLNRCIELYEQLEEQYERENERPTRVSVSTSTSRYTGNYTVDGGSAVPW